MTMIPLNDKEEAILNLLVEINKLKQENENLKEHILRLQWTIQEQD